MVLAQPKSDVLHDPVDLMNSLRRRTQIPTLIFRFRCALTRFIPRPSSMFRRPASVGLLALFAVLASVGTVSAQSGLVAAYGFNEGSGTTTADASGNGNTG